MTSKAKCSLHIVQFGDETWGIEMASRSGDSFYGVEDGFASWDEADRKAHWHAWANDWDYSSVDPEPQPEDEF